MIIDVGKSRKPNACCPSVTYQISTTRVSGKLVLSILLQLINAHELGQERTYLPHRLGHSY